MTQAKPQKFSSASVPLGGTTADRQVRVKIEEKFVRNLKNLEKTIWLEYLKPIYKKRKGLKNPEDSRLISVIDNGEHNGLKRLIEKVINNVDNVEQIFGITGQLNNKENPDGKIDDMIGELRAAYYLIDNGYKSIVYQKKGLDFICKKDNAKYAVEIKFIRGSDFKTKRIGDHFGFTLSSEVTTSEAAEIIKKLEKKYTKAEVQIKKYQMNDYIPLIIIVNNNPLFNFGHNSKVKKWCNSRENKTIILPNSSDIYENNPIQNPTT